MATELFMSRAFYAVMALRVARRDDGPASDFTIWRAMSRALGVS